MSRTTFEQDYEAASIPARTTAILFTGLTPVVMMAALSGGAEAVEAVMHLAMAGLARDIAQQLWAIDHPPEPEADDDTPAVTDDELADLFKSEETK